MSPALPAPILVALLAVAGLVAVRALLDAVGPGGSLRRAVARGARGLLAPLAVVVAAGCVATAVTLPSSWWPQVQAEALASLLLVQNAYLALETPAAAPGGALAGPFAHLGAVAVLGQLLLGAALLAGLAARTGRRRAGRVLAVLLAVAGVTSATYAWTRAGEPAAMVALDTGAQAWAFAAGGLLAVVGARSSRSVGRVLAAAPLRVLGALALSLYLWSGLVAAFYLAWRERPELGLRGGAVVLAVTVVLAAATVAAGRVPRVRGVVPVVVAAVTLLLVAGAWAAVTAWRPGAVVTVADPAHPGAAVRLAGYGAVPPAPVVPGPAARGADWAPGGRTCTTSALAAELRTCRDPVPDARFRVVVVGDSHVEQLLPAVRPIVAERHGEVVTMLRGACPFSTTSDTVPDDAGCASWNRAALGEITAMRPDLVVTLASRDARSPATEETPAGFVDAWRSLERVGIPVLAIRDNPRLPASPGPCIDRQPAETCTVPRAALLAATPPWTRAGPLPGSVTVLDLADTYCTATVCPAVVGNVLVYLDANHVSATFTGTAAPVVAPALLTAMERRPPGY